MIKKIKVNQLKPGMYIHDLNSQWLNHPFFGKSLNVTDDQVIDKIAKYGIEEVFIDTDIGLDVGGAAKKEETDVEVEEKIVETAGKQTEITRNVSINEEIINAKKIKNETIRTMKNIMHDVKLGKEIEGGKVESLVDNIIDSMCRNQDALMALWRLREVNEYVHNHSMSVCVLMSSFMRLLGYDSQVIREIGTGVILHDIGTVMVPALILDKQDELTGDEYDAVKKHVDYSRNILKGTDCISELALETIYQHHERLDGSGYPRGLKGEEITRLGQAIAIVDVYDALTTKRCYKHKISPTEALKMIYEWGDTQFSKELVDQFILCVGIYPVGSLVRLESGLLGIVVRHNEESLLKPVVRIMYNLKYDNTVFPYDVDLARPLDKGRADKILSCESPDRYNVHIEAYF